MIVCNQHDLLTECPLRARAADSWQDATRNIDQVGVVLIDRDDPTHIALALVGMDPAMQRMIVGSFREHLAMKEL